MTEIHYEVFHAQGRAGGWSLVEALEDRSVALERAKELVASGSTAVKVVKETHQPDTGDYMSLTIFEEGKLEVKKKAKIDDEISSVPCFKPDDLYSYHARMTMARLLGEWLARQRLTVTELIHSAEALEKFEATGTTYQHAIQKVAVASAADAEVPVAQLVKQLMELCTAAIHRVYKDERRGLFQTLEAGQFKPLAEKIVKNADASYVLNGSLAKYLARAKSWDAKLQRVLALMDELPADGPVRALLLNSIDTIVAEMLNGAAALADLLGPNPDLGHALLNLVQLFLGAPADAFDGGDGGINALAQHFAKDDLPNARAAIAERILTELKGMKRLCPDSLDDELKMLRRLANHLVRGQGKYLSHEDLIGAFIDRSKRLVTHEPLAQFMASAKTGDEKVDRLLTIEESLIGVENKRTLCSFIVPIIGSNGFENQLCAGGSPVQRLRRATELQERVLRSGFQDIEKARIASALDAVAVQIEKRTGFLASLETRLTNPVERAQAILKLCTANIFTEGELSAKVRRQLLAALAKPGFLAGYVAQVGREKKTAVDRDEVLTELVGRLEQAGIAPEDGLRAVAA